MIKINIKNTIDQSTQILELDESEIARRAFTIGRATDCDILLNSISVSRKHARISIIGDQLILVDNGSTSGTFFNDSQLIADQKHNIQSNGIYLIGPFELTFFDIQLNIKNESSEKTVLIRHLPNSYQPVAMIDKNAWKIWDGSKTKMTCTNIYNETHDVKTFSFTAQANTLFQYQAGQFATLHLNIDGKPVTRCYTISSTPSRPHSISHTIKRTPATGNYPPGVASNWLHDNMKIGDNIEISSPAGHFSCFAHPSNKLCFISGGSGITPMLSMTRWISDTGANVDVVFIHVAKEEKDIIARQELEMLSEQNKNIRLVFTLTRKDENNRWSGYTGRLSTELLQHAVPDLLARRVFVCGPAPFMESTKELLANGNFPMDRYHEESFGGPKPASKVGSETTIRNQNSGPRFGLQAVLGDLSQSFTHTETQPDEFDAQPSPNNSSTTDQITFSKSDITVQSNGETILEAAESSGLSLPYGCRQGMCGACKAIKSDGNLQQDNYDDSILSEDDKDAGYILLCTGKAKGPIVVDA